MLFRSGNTPLELLAAVMQQLELNSNLNLYKVLDAADIAKELFAKNLPFSNSVTIVSGLAGVFSGFAKPVQRIAKEMKLDARDIFFELGKRKVVGGQEDLILEVANDLAHQK